MKVTRENTHKQNLINDIFNKIGLPSSYISSIVDEIITILIINISTQKTIKIKNFGTFFLKKKDKRVGRNPKSKINYDISERYVVTFKPADKLKRKVNANVKK